ncbi:MAG: DUF4249 family protein [Bacteroidota bacterium]
MRRLLLIAAVVVTSWGCETGVEAIRLAEEPFTLYGFLSTSADTQFVRVVPIEADIDNTQERPIDATVTLTNLQTMQVDTWSLSTLQYDDGSYGYIFFSSAPFVAGQTYRLAATASDARTSSVVVKALESLPVFQDTGVIIERGDELTVRHGFFTPVGDVSPNEARVTYRVRANRVGAAVEDVVLTSPASAFEQVNVSINPNPFWRIQISLSDDRFRLAQALRERGEVATLDQCIVIESIEVRILAVDETWLALQEIEGDLITDPLAFSNVENGLGFVGSGGVTTKQWAPFEFYVQAADMLLPGGPNTFTNYQPDCR